MSCYKKGNSRLVQKVVIPKGMINPGETTIIEIPSSLQKQPIVVAKRKTSYDSMNCAFNDSGKHKGGKLYSRGQCQTKAAATNCRELADTEKKEREQFIRDLEEFQRARRKLLANASFLAGDKKCPGTAMRKT